MTGIGVIINPHSRRNRADKSRGQRLARIVGDAGVVAECGTLDELARTAEDFRRQQVSILAIGGGDGSNSVVTTHFHRVYGDVALPKLATLRGGTMNIVANSVGIPDERPETILERLVHRYLTGEPLPSVTRPTMSVDGKLGFLFGAGVIYGFLSEYYAAGHGHPTPLTAATTLARGSASAFVGGPLIRRMAAPILAELVVNGEHWPMRRYLGLAAGTVSQIGLGFSAFHRAHDTSTGFHFLGVHGSAVKLVSRLARIYKGEGAGEDVIREALAEEVIIHTPGGTVQYMIDGDLYESASPLCVSAGPQVQLVTGLHRD